MKNNIICVRISYNVRHTSFIKYTIYNNNRAKRAYNIIYKIAYIHRGTCGSEENKRKTREKNKKEKKKRLRKKKWFSKSVTGKSSRRFRLLPVICRAHTYDNASRRLKYSCGERARCRAKTSRTFDVFIARIPPCVCVWVSKPFYSTQKKKKTYYKKKRKRKEKKRGNRNNKKVITQPLFLSLSLAYTIIITYIYIRI